MGVSYHFQNYTTKQWNKNGELYAKFESTNSREEQKEVFKEIIKANNWKETDIIKAVSDDYSFYVITYCNGRMRGKTEYPEELKEYNSDDEKIDEEEKKLKFKMETGKEKMPAPVTVYYIYGSLVERNFGKKHKNLPEHKHIQTFIVPHDQTFDQMNDDCRYDIIGVEIFSLESGQNSDKRLPDTMRTDYVALYEKFREACLDLEIPMEKGEFFTVTDCCKCCT